MTDGALDPAAIPPGTNVLLTGPAMTGKRRLVLELVAGDPGGGDDDRGAVLVTTRTPAAALARAYADLGGATGPDRLGIVDCAGGGGGVRIGSRETEPGRRYLSGPGDLTGVGIGLTEFLYGFHREGLDVRVGVHSLSTMLMYADLRRVFRFLHVVTGRIEGEDFVGVFALDETGTDDHATLAQLFDAEVRVREGEDGRELRVRGRGAGRFGPRDWTPAPLS